LAASPSFEITVGRFGVWFTAAGGLVAGAAAALVAWWLQRSDAQPVPVLAVGVALACLGVALHGVRAVRPTRLHWDGQRWSAAPPDGVATPVELNVAIDLGVWLLLRLRRGGDQPRWSGRTMWLPVQRRGHEAHWHALRCAVYSPRPASGDPTAAEP
jgi:hypothetical protein